MQKRIDRKEIKKAINKLKCGKAANEIRMNNCRNVIIWRRNSGRMDVPDM